MVHIVLALVEHVAQSVKVLELLLLELVVDGVAWLGALILQHEERLRFLEEGDVLAQPLLQLAEAVLVGRRAVDDRGVRDLDAVEQLDHLVDQDQVLALPVLAQVHAKVLRVLSRLAPMRLLQPRDSTA